VMALAPALAVMKVTHDDAGGNDTHAKAEKENQPNKEKIATGCGGGAKEVRPLDVSHALVVAVRASAHGAHLNRALLHIKWALAHIVSRRVVVAHHV